MKRLHNLFAICMVLVVIACVMLSSVAVDLLDQGGVVDRQEVEAAVVPPATMAHTLSMIALEVSEESTPDAVNPYCDLEVSEYEKEMLAKTVYNEARGEEFDGQVAVVLVALNRVLHDSYPNNVSDVLLAPNQFSVGYKYTETQMEAVEAALDGSDVLDLNTDVTYFSTGGLKYGSYFKTIGHHVFRTFS